MPFRRKLAGLLFLLLAVAGSAHAAPGRTIVTAALSGYVQLIDAAENQLREERQEQAFVPHPGRPATAWRFVSAFAGSESKRGVNSRAPPTTRS